ncbi:hypothetical protein LJE71_13310, partial [Xanthobacter autotrophicus]
MKMRLRPVGVLVRTYAVLFGLACAAALGTVAPAAAQNDGNLFGNLFKPPQPAQEASREDPELMERMERLESTLRQLTGQVEQLQYRNQQLEAQVRRLEEAGGGRPSAAPSAA